MNRPRALVLSDSALGDLVSSTIVIAALCERMEVDLITRPSLADFGVFVPEARVVTFAYAQEQRYDHIVDVTSSSATRKMVAALKGRLKWGRADGFWHRLKSRITYNRLVSKTAAGNIVRDFDALLLALGFSIGGEPSLVVPVNVDLPVGFSKIGDYVAIHVGAGNPLRVLPDTLIKDLALRAREEGSEVVLIGTEAGAAESINTAIGGFALYKPLSLPQLAVVLKGARQFIAPDSGPFHLAVALGANVTGVYGPNLASLAAPPRAFKDENSRLVEHAWPCRPCDQNKTCPYEVRCMRSVAATEISF